MKMTFVGRKFVDLLMEHGPETVYLGQHLFDAFTTAWGSATIRGAEVYLDDTLPPYSMVFVLEGEIPLAFGPELWMEPEPTGSSVANLKQLGYTEEGQGDDNAETKG
jgi:hypothetical protein